jgi:hypothetical protein
MRRVSERSSRGVSHYRLGIQTTRADIQQPTQLKTETTRPSGFDKYIMLQHLDSS